MRRSDAEALIEAIIKLRENATDAQASMAVGAYQKLKQDGNLISSGTRINWNGDLKRATVDLWDFEENNPDHSPNLWEDIVYRLGYRMIPDIITVGLAFSLNECGWWNDRLYRSKIDMNTYTPDQYQLGWELVTEE